MSRSHACSKGDSMEQAQLQEDELMALEAILPPSELTLTSDASPSPALVRLVVPAILSGSTRIIVRSHIHSAIEETSGEGCSLESKARQSKTVTGATQQDCKESTNVRVEDILLEGITFLPPLRLLIRLPADYPTYSAPEILQIAGEHVSATSINVRSSSKRSRKAQSAASSAAASLRATLIQWLRQALMQLWSSEEVLFTWHDYLKESLWQDISTMKKCPFVASPGTLIFEEYVVEEESDFGRKKFESPLATLLRSNDIISKRKEFEGERFGCGICLEEKRGGKCWKVSECGHVFCQECLSGYLSSMIREGYIRQAAACPDPECVKTRVASEKMDDAEHLRGTEKKKSEQVGSITPAELLLFVGPELVKRLSDLRDRALASTDPTAGYCPRPGCEKLVRGNPTDVGTMYESMRECDCGFTYCLYCNKAWHGKSPCNLMSSTALIERYQRAEEGSTIRREMEVKYGKSNLERMVKNHEEEVQNKEYIESHTQRCPCCSVRIEKSMGCNHMTCRSCHTHLCYRCGTRLDPNEPYRHFNTPGTPCYQKLFDVFLGGNGEDVWNLPEVNEDEMDRWEAEQL
ncbi:hypothetical protein CBS101457_001260 [Exobasidium rhododendri]|nr:hypothetical protein CBS101457_001260 [Exobasidium rhododendri]